MYRTQFIYRQETITVLSWKYVYSLQFLEYGKDDKDIVWATQKANDTHNHPASINATITTINNIQISFDINI